jgi:hypothetical protein
MRSFFIIAALVGTYATANAAEHFTPVGAPPICEVDAQGITHVFYVHAQHPSFKCTHSGSTCACTLQHPTHHKGGCKQLESKAAGKLLDTGGDCTDSGKNTAAPTPAPTPPPTPVVWAGSDLAADVALMTDGATINLAAGNFAWTSDVTCAGKTLTLTGAGKGATVLDAGGVRRFFTLNSGCTLVLSKLSLRNGKVKDNQYGAAILANSGSTLDARDMEFKDNSAGYVRHSRATALPPPRRPRPRAQPPPLTRPHPPAAHTPPPTQPPAAPSCPRRTRSRNPGRRGVQLRRHRFLHELRFHFEFRRRYCAFAPPPPPALARAATAAHPPNPAPTALARLRATQGGALYITGGGTTTFASTLPANSFSGNTAHDSHGPAAGNCGGGGSAHITGSCS